MTGHRVTLATSEWLDRFFEMYYRQQPVSATFIGVHERDGELPDFSQGGVAAQLAEIRAALAQADGGQVSPPVSKWEALDRLLARNALLTREWELSDARVLLANPSLYTGEAVFGVISLLLCDYCPLDERIDAATRRLAATPDLLAQGQANVTSAPGEWVERATDECDGALALLSDGVAVLEQGYGVTSAGFHDAAASAAEAFRSHREHLSNHVERVEFRGVGADAFDTLLRRAHCLAIDGRAVVEYGLKRLEDARAGMRAAADRIDPAADPSALLAQLSDEHPALGDYYAAYQREWDAARAFAIERDLLSWPDYPIGFEPIPEWARAAAPHLYFLYYRSPAPFDPNVTQRYLVTPVERDMPLDEQERRLRASNMSQIRLNHVIHHGGMGHHVQNWWAYRGESRVGRIAAVDCSLRIAMLSGGTMAEGWSCYATRLMAEQGYLTPLEELAEQHGLARMAGRAIVDARVHRGELTLDGATAYYRDEIGMPEAAARSEAVKNSMFPGAAIMYLTGTDMIHDLRDEMQRRLGSGFSLRSFHDEFLSHGSIPVALIAALMTGRPIDAEGYVAPIGNE
ncbi:MAG TPA: DUF885 domain-containing protein [Thermomicrobiales bacterium]|nr:DUF885 domain-containing protein [Thermomicrobiales bacterium]